MVSCCGYEQVRPVLAKQLSSLNLWRRSIWTPTTLHWVKWMFLFSFCCLSWIDSVQSLRTKTSLNIVYLTTFWRFQYLRSDCVFCNQLRRIIHMLAILIYLLTDKLLFKASLPFISYCLLHQSLVTSKSYLITTSCKKIRESENQINVLSTHWLMVCH